MLVLCMQQDQSGSGALGAAEVSESRPGHEVPAHHPGTHQVGPCDHTHVIDSAADML